MTEYVLGFLFSETLEEVLLIEKIISEWQTKKFNGISGKIELNEFPIEAMIREFKKETGLEINEWNQFVTIIKENEYIIYCFYAIDNILNYFENKTDRKLQIFYTYEINIENKSLMSNISWLIPMAIDKILNDDFRATIIYN